VRGKGRRQDWPVQLQLLKQPKTIILLTALAGLLPLVSFYSFTYLPAAEARDQALLEWNALQEERASLQQTPVPEPFRQEEARALLSKVPVTENHALLLQQLLQVEDFSGAVMTKLTIGEAEKPPEDLLQTLQTLQSTQQTAPSNPPTQEQQPAAGTAPAAAAAPGGLTTELISVEVSGSFEEAMAFWRGIAALDRITLIHTWGLSDQKELLAPAEAASDSYRTKVSLSLSFYVYTAPAFVDLEGLQANNESGPARQARNDPTMGDDSFYSKLLQP
jgi:hypothetical protein